MKPVSCRKIVIRDNPNLYVRQVGHDLVMSLAVGRHRRLGVQGKFQLLCFSLRGFAGTGQDLYPDLGMRSDCNVA